MEITDNDMALGGHPKYLPCADIQTLRQILAETEKKYTPQFKEQTAAELTRRELANLRANLTAKAREWDALAILLDSYGNPAAHTFRQHADELRKLLEQP